MSRAPSPLRTLAAICLAIVLTDGSARDVAFSSITLHEFAVFFRDGLNCPDALYFDGVVSSLCAPGLNRCDARSELGPMIAVVE